MAFDPPADRRSIDALRAIMANLRAPVGGCPWDVEQDHRSIARYCIEEAYEVVDAIENGTDRDLCDELGDLLLQVVFHAQMASERGAFNFDDVVQSISDKMVRRHPHVFVAEDGRDAEEQTAAWEDIKAQERAEKGKAESILDDVPIGLPALTRAEKIAKRVARVGFDWPDWRGVTAKLREELAEVEEAILEDDEDHIREEVGDFLFTAACLTRAVKVEGETVLREANEKFRRRFANVEAGVRNSGRSWEDHSLADLEAYWEAGKAAEKTA
ncbi:MAG: nucleoside triphosphate pyrophosphohydrolase [Pseudomonadota bacterium]